MANAMANETTSTSQKPQGSVPPPRPDLLRPRPSALWVVPICVALALAIAAWAALIVGMNASSDYGCAEMFARVPNPGTPAMGVSALLGFPSLAISLFCAVKVWHGRWPLVFFACLTYAVSALGGMTALLQGLSLTGC